MLPLTYEMSCPQGFTWVKCWSFPYLSRASSRMDCTLISQGCVISTRCARPIRSSPKCSTISLATPSSTRSNTWQRMYMHHSEPNLWLWQNEWSRNQATVFGNRVACPHAVLEGVYPKRELVFQCLCKVLSEQLLIRIHHAEGVAHGCQERVQVQPEFKPDHEVFDNMKGKCRRISALITDFPMALKIS